MSRILAALLTLMALALVAAPAPGPTSVSTAPRGPLVLAASSMQESLNAAADAWARKGHPRPVISFAASSALARQIEAGAPADLFVSADEQWMDYLAGKRLVQPGTRVAIVSNRLALVAPAESRVRLAIAPRFGLVQALGSGRLALADPDAVPAGRYGKEALTRLGVWPSVSGRIARAENVRAALALVGRGAAPLGIVYVTDARADRTVRIVDTFPASTHAPIRYPLARLTASRHRDAEAFRRFLVSSEGMAVFRRFGFAAR